MPLGKQRQLYPASGQSASPLVLLPTSGQGAQEQAKKMATPVEFIGLLELSKLLSWTNKQGGKPATLDFSATTPDGSDSIQYTITSGELTYTFTLNEGLVEPGTTMSFPVTYTDQNTGSVQFANVPDPKLSDAEKSEQVRKTPVSLTISKTDEPPLELEGTLKSTKNNNNTALIVLGAFLLAFVLVEQKVLKF